jgi:hypothetical protein
MTRFGAGFTTFAAATTLCGCAEFTHLTRTRQLGTEGTGGRNQAFFIDAKQRVVFQRGGIVCAEPSPDALSALAASQGLSVATPSGTSVGQSLSIAEAAGAIGLRTQSIQLMRDHMYRVCEGYLSGAISGLTFQLLHRRFQTTMVGILAIEQLTSAVRAPAIVLGSSANVGDAQAVTQLTAAREAAASGVGEAETGLKSAKAAEEAANGELASAEATLASAGAGDAAALANAQKAADDKKAKAEKAAADALAADGVLAGRKTALAAVDRQLLLARSSGSATASGAIEAITASSVGNVSSIASTVGQIVKETMSLTNQNDFCVMVLAEAAEREPRIDVRSDVVQDCRAVLRSGGMPIGGR